MKDVDQVVNRLSLGVFAVNFSGLFLRVVGTKAMRRKNLRVCCFLVLVGCWAPIAMAEPVVLVSNDGYSNFKGDLIKTDGKMYVLKTSVGVVRIPVSEVVCKGAGCPDRKVRSVDKAPTGIPSPVSSAPPSSSGRVEISKELEKELVRDYRANELFKEFLQWREKTEK